MRSGRFLTKWPLVHQGGGGPHFPAALKHMRLVRHGCTNRPFYHIVIIMASILTIPYALSIYLHSSL